MRIRHTLLTLLVLISVSLIPVDPAYTSKFYAATSLTGSGDGDLDKIDGAGLSVGDCALVITTDEACYPYVLLSDGATENSPMVISPDTNAGTKRWHLALPYGLQAYSLALSSIANGLTETNGGIPYGTADNAYAWLPAGTQDYLLQGNGAGAPSWTNAPTVSGMNITGVNASALGGATFAAPGAIGGGTAAAGTFTTLSAGAAGFTVDADGDTAVKSITTAATASPTYTVLDSDAPGTDKEITKLVGAYVDGADGSENGTYDLYVHQAGTSTSYIQLDGKNLDVEINKPLRLYTANDPDTTTAGQIAHDANGGWLRVYDNSLQKAVRLQEEIHVTVIKPNDLDDAQRDAFLVWSNESGMNFIVTGWKGWSDTDNTTLNIETTAADGQTNATVDAVEIATNGTNCYYGSDTTITADTIANGSLIWLDFDNDDTPGIVKMTIYGYYNADVN